MVRCSQESLGKITTTVGPQWVRNARDPCVVYIGDEKSVRGSLVCTRVGGAWQQYNCSQRVLPCHSKIARERFM